MKGTALRLISIPLGPTTGRRLIAAALRLLTELEKLGPADPGFDTQFVTVRESVEEHARQEELHELPLLQQLHDEGTRQTMAKAFQAAEAIAPTHPHPHGPDGMVGNLVVGPFVSVVDRVRDAIQGGHR